MGEMTDLCGYCWECRALIGLDVDNRKHIQLFPYSLLAQMPTTI